MNTDKTLRDNFATKYNDYPVWYYKQIEEVDVDYVIWYLLKETFVVELNNKKIVITFGKNRKHEIGSSQSCKCGLDYTSYETINKAFREGKWFKITDKNTTDEFKEEYKIQEAERERIESREFNIEMITRAIDMYKSISQEKKEMDIAALKNTSDEDLEKLVEILFDSFKK